MSDPFESAIFSVNWGSKHFQNFDRLATEFMASNPYTLRTDFNAETGLNEVKIKIVRDFPEDLRGLASDIIKNIRDALDQAMYAATLVVTGKKSRQAHFPFGESEADLENSLWSEADRRSDPPPKKTRNTRDIPEALFPAIRYIKPYPHEGDNFRLKLLQKVSGPHKHNVALTLGAASYFPFEMFGMTDADGTEAVRVNFPHSGSLKEETVIATHGGDGAFHFNNMIHVGFDHPELVKIPANIVLQGWGRRTEWIINGLKKTAEQIVAERGG